MYRGKHKKKVSRTAEKSLVLLAAVALMLWGTVIGAIAFLNTKTEPITNTFATSKVTTEVSEDFENGVKSNVCIKNTEDTTAWIRAKVVITWQDKDGHVSGQVPVAGTDYEIEYGTSRWLKGNDGFYYYTSPVEAGGKTDELIEKCTQKQGKAPEGYSLCVEIICSGLQSQPASAFETSWASSGLKVGSDEELFKPEGGSK